MPLLVLCLAGLLVFAIFLALLVWLLRGRRRELTLRRLLDLADAMQALLDRSQARMEAMKAVVGRVPADIAAVANASLDGASAIRDAKRELLQHRLWIQKHGASATQRELEQACAALERAHSGLSSQLDALEAAGAELAEATQASAEAARREPPALRRGAESP